MCSDAAVGAVQWLTPLDVRPSLRVLGLQIRVKGSFLLGVEGSSPSLHGAVPEAIDVQGRIRQDEVWQYVLKLKISTSKEIVIMRLRPADDDDEVGYISIFSYFNSRRRCGVLGSKHKSSTIKDMYLVPVSAQQGLPSGLTDCYMRGSDDSDTTITKDELLIVVVRNAEVKKRKRPIDSVDGGHQQHKVPKLSRPTNNDEEEAYS